MAWGWFGATSIGLVFFPAAGVTLAALTICTTGRWATVLLATAATELLVNAQHHLSIQTSIGFAIANVVEPLVGATVIRVFRSTSRSTNRRLDIGSSADIVAFVMGGLIAGPLAGGLIGATVNELYQHGIWWIGALRWWAGDGLGVLCVAAPILAVSGTEWKRRSALVSGVAIGLAIGALSFLILYTSNQLALIFLLLPALLLVSLRSNLLSLGVATLVAATVANLATASGHGPFGTIRDVSPHMQLVLAQLYLAATFLTAWFFAAERAMRLRAETQHFSDLENRGGADRLADVASISLQLASAFTVVEIIDAFGYYGRHNHGANIVRVGRFATDTGEFIRFDPRGDDVGSGEGENFARLSKPIFVDSADDLNRQFPMYTKHQQEHGIESMAVLPLDIDMRPAMAILSWTQPKKCSTNTQASLYSASQLLTQALTSAISLDNAQAARIEAELAVERLKILQRLTADLGSATSSKQIAEIATRETCVVLKASNGTLTTLDLQTDELVSEGGFGPPDHQWDRVSTTHESPVSEAMATRKSVVLRTPADFERFVLPSDLDTRADTCTEACAVIVGRSVGSEICALTFGFDRAENFDDGDIDFMQAIADQCAQAVVRTRLSAAEHDAVIRMQRVLLPRALKSTTAISISACYRPAAAAIAVGGDWYDVIDLPGQRTMLIVGDVVGQGLKAALTMGQLRSAAHALAVMFGPAQLLDALDRFSDSIDGANFATVACAIIDPLFQEICYSIAGHPPPLVRAPDGTVTQLEGTRGTPIGASRNNRTEATMPLPPNSVVLLYTDGLVERRREVIDVGLDRAASALKIANTTSPRWCEALIDSCLEPSEQHDDVAVLGAELTDSVTSLKIEYPPNDPQLNSARRTMRDWLAALGLARADIDDLLLAMGEGISNSLQYASHLSTEPIVVQITLRAAGKLDVSIEDHGTWIDRPNSEPSEGGRGLTIIYAIMDSVEIDRTIYGTTLRMSRQLSRPHSQ